MVVEIKRVYLAHSEYSTNGKGKKKKKYIYIYGVLVLVLGAMETDEQDSPCLQKTKTSTRLFAFGSTCPVVS